MKQNDTPYLDLVLESIRVCAKYKPKFGQGNKSGGPDLGAIPNLVSIGPVLQLVRA